MDVVVIRWRSNITKKAMSANVSWKPRSIGIGSSLSISSRKATRRGGDLLATPKSARVIGSEKDVSLAVSRTKSVMSDCGSWNLQKSVAKVGFVS